MTDSEHLTLQTMAAMAAIRALVQSHPDRAKYQQRFDGLIAQLQAGQAGWPQEHRDTFRRLCEGLRE